VLSRLDVRWAAAGCALSFLIIVGLAIRWQILLRQQALSFPFGKIFSLTWAGQFFNSILPGSTGGDLIKIYQLCRFAPTRKAAAVATIFTDRLSALIALVVLAGIGFLVQPAPLRVIAGERVSASGALALMAAAGAVGLLVLWLLLRWGRGSKWVDRVERTFAAARRHFVLSPQLFVVGVLAFGVHVINFSVVYLFARALGIAVSYTQILTMMPVVLFVVLIPVTINGHGLRELLLIAYFTEMSVTVSGHAGVGYNETAIALSLVMVANDLIWSLPGGLAYLMRFRAPGGSELVAPSAD